MSEAIQVLVGLASNATLNNQDNITTMLAEADISLEQEKAIKAKDAKRLLDASDEISKIKFFIPIAPAEDDEPEESNEEETETNNLLAIIG
ncbi:hypothetical protein [Litorilituus lipolyticus]|uniref:Uncharacterized protein n=1 Tax=Litorilituus lipolyticus TaxID=2491017 RepID=A0A502KYB9_9GAMM|nr:hypothetical protein [Litorilituus lipolyticus]TPH15165.1 hypothetical protein EPA86_10125 [Litorilituus lipolyticus]